MPHVRGFDSPVLIDLEGDQELRLEFISKIPILDAFENAMLDGFHRTKDHLGIQFILIFFFVSAQFDFVSFL